MANPLTVQTRVSVKFKESTWRKTGDPDRIPYRYPLSVDRCDVHRYILQSCKNYWLFKVFFNCVGLFKFYKGMDSWEKLPDPRQSSSVFWKRV
jgi:hypothetical protein